MDIKIGKDRHIVCSDIVDGLNVHVRECILRLGTMGIFCMQESVHSDIGMGIICIEKIVQIEIERDRHTMYPRECVFRLLWMGIKCMHESICSDSKR